MRKTFLAIAGAVSLGLGALAVQPAQAQGFPFDWGSRYDPYGPGPAYDRYGDRRGDGWYADRRGYGWYDRDYDDRPYRRPRADRFHRGYDERAYERRRYSRSRPSGSNCVVNVRRHVPGVGYVVEPRRICR